MSFHIPDPGVGSATATVGTREWAEHVRLKMQGLVRSMPENPRFLQLYVDKVMTHRAWTLMSKPDGSCFATWEEFCSFRHPWGLGKPWEEIRPYLEAAAGKRAVQLATVAPAQPAGNERVERAKDPKAPEEPLVAGPGEAHTKRLRAIAERSPEPVRELYRDDLIGAKEAAALGPKNPSPEEAARVTEIANAAKAIAKEKAPKTPAERRKVKKEINAKVRELSGREADPIHDVARALQRVTPDRMADLVEAMNDQTARLLLSCLRDRFGTHR